METDGEQQRGAGGRRLRYFMARQVQREHDGRIPRIRITRVQHPQQVRIGYAYTYPTYLYASIRIYRHLYV